MAEERKDMRSEYVVAAVSVFIALLGIMGTLLVTGREESGEAARAKQEFIREQRRDAYAAFLSTAVEHGEARDMFFDSVMDLTQAPTAGELEPGYLSYATAYDELVLSIHTVKMTGSDGLLGALADVQTTHDAVHDGINDTMDLVRDGEGHQLMTGARRQAMRDGLKEQLRPLTEAMERFIRIARSDLGLAA